MINYYKQYLTNQILKLKANNGSKIEIQKLDKANNKANNKSSDE